MVSFGTRLKKEREQRGISLDDVSLSTKIGTRMLRALEDEKFEQLPGGIFNKGFVRAYARYLGIDEDQAVADYLEASGENPPAPPQSPTPSAKSQEKRHEAPVTSSSVLIAQAEGQKQSAFPLGIVAAVLLAVALGLWTWKRYSEPPQSSAPESSNSQTQASGAPAAPSAPEQGAQQSVPGASGQASSPTSTSSASPPATGSAPVPRAGSEPSSPAAPPKAIAGAATAGAFAVRIRADHDSWLSIQADGKTLYEGMLVAPAERTVHAQKQIILRSGNVGGLALTFNGRPLSSQGAEGEVKTLMFGPEGLEVASSAGEENPPR
ncbi:MAG TPA: RodZ domain-containing protein [Terriglobales bacterium]|nr:RodZ domain-containing protein [Terriglobales bacterium]